jgi:putative ABC transport system permease protein
MNEIILLALDSLRANKLRSLLTVLGVVIGVATVIGMSSIISGLNSTIASQIEDLGSNLIFIGRIAPSVGQFTPEMLRRKFLTLEDAQAISELSLIQSVAPIVRHFVFSLDEKSFAVRYGNRSAKNTIIQGVTPQTQTVMNIHLAAGRWINEADSRHKSNVVVIGHDTAETIFPINVDPIGKDVELEGTMFRVIGVMEKLRDALTPGANPNDNVVQVPVGAFWKLHPEEKDIMIVAKPVSQAAMPNAIGQIEQLLRNRRGIPLAKEIDFAIFTQDVFVDLWNQISSGIFTVMLAISSIALVVGGVGVMNIMLVSVTERTHEIGVRKAIGATQRNILMQFLFEAMVLTAVGGILGILAGGGIAVIVRKLAPFLPASVSAFWVLLGFATSVGTGLVFGMYPAYRAAILSPIEALRHE